MFFLILWVHQSIQDERVEHIDGICQENANDRHVEHIDGMCRFEIMPSMAHAI